MKNMIEEGKAVPKFQLEDADGNLVKSSQLKGQKYVVYFYPRDFTPGCTTEADEFSIKCYGDKMHSTRWVAFCKIVKIDKTIFTRTLPQGLVSFDKIKIINEFSKSRLAILKKRTLRCRPHASS